jgi:SAM-dependent methyltransferase
MKSRDGVCALEAGPWRVVAGAESHRGRPLNQVDMQHEPVVDVPSAIDLRERSDAEAWAQTAMSKRPWRDEFFARIASEIAGNPHRRVLELGSGPGFLARAVIETVEDVDYTLLDFSDAMHELARERLGDLVVRAHFVTASFKHPEWTDGLGRFDYVITMQAVHELRHKAYARALHAQVRTILDDDGHYLVCDHYVGADGMKNDQLYMTPEEQRHALKAGGFASVRELMKKGGLILHHAE